MVQGEKRHKMQIRYKRLEQIRKSLRASMHKTGCKSWDTCPENCGCDNRELNIETAIAWEASACIFAIISILKRNPTSKEKNELINRLSVLDGYGLVLSYHKDFNPYQAFIIKKIRAASMLTERQIANRT